MLRICQPLKDEYYCSSVMYIMVKNNAIDTTVPLKPTIVQSTTVIYIPCQNVSPTGCKFLERKYNPRLHTNQLILTTHVSLHRYFLFVCTIYMCLSFSVESGVSGLTFKYCSSPSAITNPIA